MIGVNCSQTVSQILRLARKASIKSVNGSGQLSGWLFKDRVPHHAAEWSDIGRFALTFNGYEFATFIATKRAPKMAKKKGQSKSASAVKQPFQEKYYVTPGFTVFYLRHKNLTIQYSPRSFGDGAIYFTRNETLNEPSKEDIEITKEQYEEILQAILAELNKLIESDGSYQLTDLLDSFKVCAIRP